MVGIRLSVAVTLLLSASACVLKESPTPPPTLPSSFGHISQSATQWPSADWYRAFGSEELNRFIDEATRLNLDFAMSRARVVQADARSRQAGAALLPAADIGGNINYLAGHSSQGSAHETDWGLLLNASYEVDFWGKNRAAARSASDLANAARADRDTIALTTLADVATEYFRLLSLRERLEVAAANKHAAGQLLEVVQARFDVGLANPVELATEKAVLANATLAIPELNQQETETLAGLAILLGHLPEGFTVEATSLQGISEPRVSPGLPSEFVTRRPDVFQAEANMRAAHADLIVARAALLPSLSLTASGGLQNPALNAAVLSLSGTGPTLNLGAALLQPIFDGGKLRAARAEVQARDEELVMAYRAAILAAFNDVEIALGAVQHLDEASAPQAVNLAESERAFDGANLRFKAGSGDFLSVLEAQRTLYAARDQFSQYKLNRLQASVALCKALGGGWEAPDPQRTAKELP
ncbi:MAG TPA: efflux transporter outer membrane subunit [Steroidobacteraceae bacterium]|jgi:NodT family efflux transporter outer membrane factor (OMF) lipoprotein